MDFSEEALMKLRESRLVTLTPTTIVLTLVNRTGIVTVADTYVTHQEEGWVHLYKENELVYSRRLEDVIAIKVNRGEVHV